MVITIKSNLLLFKSDNVNIASDAPTEQFHLPEVTQIGSFNDTIFYILIQGHNHQFRAPSSSIKSQWIEDIGKYQHKYIRIPITVQCVLINNNQEFNSSFHLLKPYNFQQKYSIKQLILDIMDKQHQSHPNHTFAPVKIRSTSFLNSNVDMSHQ